MNGRNQQLRYINNRKNNIITWVSWIVARDFVHANCIKIFVSSFPLLSHFDLFTILLFSSIYLNEVKNELHIEKMREKMEEHRNEIKTESIMQDVF